MKGVSAVIAVILILMIVVALAALAYTWFTGIFSTLTQTAGTSVTTTTQTMSYAFTLEAAKCDNLGDANPANDVIRATVRNTGTATLTGAAITTYINDVLYNHAAIADINAGQSRNFDVTQTPAGTRVDCTAPGTDIGKVLKATIQTGLAQTKVIE